MNWGLKEPEFIQEKIFKTVIWRAGQVSGQATVQVTVQSITI